MWNELLLVLFILVIIIVVVIAGPTRKEPETVYPSEIYYHNPVHDTGPSAPKSILRTSKDAKNKKHIQFADNRDEIVYDKKTNAVLSRVAPPT